MQVQVVDNQHRPLHFDDLRYLLGVNTGKELLFDPYIAILWEHCSVPRLQVPVTGTCTI